jgi:ABC-type transport system involved in multi-copper enzyme maturation permease subunit
VSGIGKAAAIGRVTFSEIVRDRVFYGSAFLALFLQFLSLLASKLTFIRPERVVADLGWTSILLANLGLGVLVGASVLPKEFENRTAQLVLSKPISVLTFLAGKALGIAGVLACNGMLFAAVWCLALSQTGASLVAVHIQAAFCAFAIAVLASLIAFFFSSFSSRALSLLIAIGCYGVGVNLSQLASAFPGMATRILSGVFPDFEGLHMGLRVSYGIAMPLGEFTLRMCGSAAWCFALVSAAALGLKRKP